MWTGSRHWKGRIWSSSQVRRAPWPTCPGFGRAGWRGRSSGWWERVSQSSGSVADSRCWAALWRTPGRGGRRLHAWDGTPAGGHHLSRKSPENRSIVKRISLTDFMDGSRGCPLEGYEIHMGTSGGESIFTVEGRVLGTYLHGLFDSGAFTCGLVDLLLDEKGWSGTENSPAPRTPVPLRNGSMTGWLTCCGGAWTWRPSIEFWSRAWVGWPEKGEQYDFSLFRPGVRLFWRGAPAAGVLSPAAASGCSRRRRGR